MIRFGKKVVLDEEDQDIEDNLKDILDDDIEDTDISTDLDDEDEDVEVKDDYKYDDEEDPEVEEPDTFEDIPDLEDEEDELSTIAKESRDLITVLRNEIKKMEPDRDYLLFRYKGNEYEGKPMAEMTGTNKFIFKINNSLKAVNLSEIHVI